MIQVIIPHGSCCRLVSIRVLAQSVTISPEHTRKQKIQFQILVFKRTTQTHPEVFLVISQNRTIVCRNLTILTPVQISKFHVTGCRIICLDVFNIFFLYNSY